MGQFPDFADARQLAALTEMRRALHRYPELSWLEYVTTARLCEALTGLGFRVRWGESLYAGKAPPNPPSQGESEEAFRQAEQELGADNPWLPAMRHNRTGLVATLEGGQPGPTLGVRLDIDALPVQESSDPAHLPAAQGFASERAGIMHACGHDGHMAIGLGLAQRLVAQRADWPGRVHLFFQPAEEVAGGGKLFSELAELQGVDYFLTLHLGITDAHEVVVDTTWIAARIHDVIFSGVASHAGNAPQAGKNALLAACQAVQGLYAIPRHSEGITRVNVGRFHADNANNVIADKATFRFEVRGDSDVICDYMERQAFNILEGAALSQDVKVQHQQFAAFSSARNSEPLVETVIAAARELGIPESGIRRSYRVPASEDAGYMVSQVQQLGGQATHLIIGSPVAGGHHNPAFDFDEQMLGWSVELLMAALSRCARTGQ